MEDLRAVETGQSIKEHFYEEENLDLCSKCGCEIWSCYCYLEEDREE